MREMAHNFTTKDFQNQFSITSETPKNYNITQNCYEIKKCSQGSICLK